MTLPAVNIDLFLLVFMRMSGTIIFNPFFGRTNVPDIIKGALAFICAFLITPTLSGVSAPMNGVVQFTVEAVLELFIGLAVGFLIYAVFSVVLIAGELIDMQLGLSMANFYDPHSGVSVPILGNYLNVLFVLVFFASDAHLRLISIMTESFGIIPPGAVAPTGESLQYVVLLCKDMFEMGLRMAIPIIAIELICQVAIGMMMRAVPQMNVFNVGIQLQTIVGVAVLLLAVPILVTMCQRLMPYLFEKTAEFLKLMT